MLTTIIRARCTACFLFGLAWVAWPASAVELDRANLLLTFEENFDRSLDIYSPSSNQGRWKTSYFFPDKYGPNARTIRGELETYVDPEMGIDPFEVSNDTLKIFAKKTPQDLKNIVRGQPYTSGLITTEKSFSQLYGYFEIRAKLPKGQGYFPAFWLLPSGRPNPPEIDVMENLGRDPNLIYCTAHFSDSAGKSAQIAFKISVPDVSADFHVYGLLWTATELVWFFDDKEVARTANPGINTPMYMLANLAIGGRWGGAPAEGTVFPGVMEIDYIRAYKLAPLGK